MEPTQLCKDADILKAVKKSVFVVTFHMLFQLLIASCIHYQI